MQVCTSLQTDSHASAPYLSFLQAGCPSCHPTNSVKATLKRTNTLKLYLNIGNTALYKITYIFSQLHSHSQSFVIRSRFWFKLIFLFSLYVFLIGSSYFFTCMFYCLFYLLYHCYVHCFLLWTLLHVHLLHSVLFFSRPRSEGWPHYGRTFSIYLCPLSFWLTRGVLSTSWCCLSRLWVFFQ